MAVAVVVAVVVFVVRVNPAVVPAVPARATAAVLLLLLDDEVVRGLPPRPQNHVEPGELVHLQMGERVDGRDRRVRCGEMRNTHTKGALTAAHEKGRATQLTRATSGKRRARATTSRARMALYGKSIDRPRAPALPLYDKGGG